MNAQDMLKQAKELLKAAKEDPKQFEVLDKASSAPPPAPPKARYGQNTRPTKPAPPAPKPSAPPMKAPAMAQAKPMMKDDQPHAPNTPKDKAHDVAEHMDHMKHALTILNTPEKQKQMLSHLKTLHEPSQLRSPQNQAAGQPKPQMNKAEILEQAKMLLKAAKEDASQFEVIKKAEAAIDSHGEKSSPDMKAQKASCRMTKAEIKEDMKKEWKPKFKKGN